MPGWCLTKQSLFTVELLIGSKCMFCLGICTPEGRGVEKGGSANFKIQHTEPLTQEINLPLYKLQWNSFFLYCFHEPGKIFDSFFIYWIATQNSVRMEAARCSGPPSPPPHWASFCQIWGNDNVMRSETAKSLYLSLSTACIYVFAVKISMGSGNTAHRIWVT